MWLENVVIIITFIFMTLQIVHKQRKNNIYTIIILILAFVFELIFAWSKFSGKVLSTFMQSLVLIFSYILPICVIVLSSLNVSFRLKILYAVAKMSYALKKYEFAAGILEGAIRKDKENLKYYYLRAKALEKLGDLAGARDMLFCIIELDKSDKQVYLKLAQVLDKEDKKDTALVMLSQALKLYPDYTEAKEMIGIIYSEIGRDQEAENIYRQLSLDDAGTYNTYYNLGIIYSRQGQIDNAIEAYKVAIEKNSKLYAAYYALGKLYYAKDEYELSVESLNKALKDNSLNSKTYYALAMAYIKLDDLEKAVDNLEKTVKLDLSMLQQAKNNDVFSVISLELKRLEDENTDLISITYEGEEKID